MSPGSLQHIVMCRVECHHSSSPAGQNLFFQIVLPCKAQIQSTVNHRSSGIVQRAQNPVVRERLIFHAGLAVQ